MPEFHSVSLADPTQAYHLYAVVPNATDGGEGTFELSATGRAFNEGGNLNLLVGILNSEFNPARSFAPL